MWTCRMLQDLLQVEIDKLNSFTVVKYEEIFRMLQSLACSATVPEFVRQDPAKCEEYLRRLESSIDAAADDVVNLDKYIRINSEGLIRLVSKFDEILGTWVTNWFVVRLSKEDFCNVNLSSLMILLSLTWSKTRAATAPSPKKEEGTWRPPESFVRSTAKYWVKSENVLRLKASVLKHLPYLIFGSSLKEQETTLLDEDQKPSGRQSISETQLITSIYFDNENRDIYRQRILRKEGARLVRFRWYGSNEGSPEQEIFIERKIHHESWSSEASAKDRFVVKQKDVFSFMKGRLDVDAKVVGKKSLELAHEVDSFIKELRLQPFIRTCYYRCAFQLSSSNAVRISLDSQMCLINEFRGNNHPQEPWCRLATEVLAEEDLVRFPYAILEVKLAADARNPPTWVESMLESCGAVQVHKFSKFLHAMAFLHPERISLFPHWFKDFLPKTTEQELSGDDGQGDRLERILISQDDSEDSESEKKKVKDMKSIEPKSIYASERTFLHYCQKAVYLLTLTAGFSVKYHDTPHSQALKWLQLVLAVAVGGYMSVVYMQFLGRQKLLLNRKSVEQSTSLRLDVEHGPVLAAAVILIGCVANFGVSLFENSSL